MTTKDNILQELAGLNSQLANLQAANPYALPEGYFDNLPAFMLARIKASSATNTGEELSYLAPAISNLSKEMPYAIPSGYFENLAESVLQKINEQALSPEKELETISPLLSSLKKEMPYRVPAGYFENIAATTILKEEPVKEAKVVSFISRKWFRYAAAAVITGIILLAGFQFFNIEKEPGGKALAKFTRDIKKMDEQQKNDMIDFFDAGLDGKESAQLSNDNKKSKKEVQDLLEGVSDEELKDFQEQTEDIQEVLMTN